VSPTTTYADVVAAVGATIAAYTHALDDGRPDDVVATFCADGGCDIPGLGTFVGHEALREAYAGWKPKQPMRHLVVNTHVAEWDDDTAKATSDVIVLVKGDMSWAVGVVGRYHDSFHHDGGGWRFHHRAADFVT